MSFLWGMQEDVLKNRTNFLEPFGISLNQCTTMRIQDRDILIEVNKSFGGKGMLTKDDALIADGLTTKENGIFLFLVVADCLPIIIFDQKNKKLALIHSGWKSTEAKFPYATAKKFVHESGSDSKDVFAAIGPAIHKESLRFKDPIQKQLPGWEAFLENQPGGETAIDIIGYVQKQLQDGGIISSNIFISPVDTAGNPDFYSHYNDSRTNPQQEGRFACVVGFK